MDLTHDCQVVLALSGWSYVESVLLLRCYFVVVVLIFELLIVVLSSSQLLLRLWPCILSITELVVLDHLEEVDQVAFLELILRSFLRFKVYLGLMQLYREHLLGLLPTNLNRIVIIIAISTLI